MMPRLLIGVRSQRSAQRPPPAARRWRWALHDLTRHRAVNIRPRPPGATYAWEFEQDGREFSVKVEGPLVFNSIMHVLNAALDGIGLAYVPQYLAAPYLVDGRLQTVLLDWCPVFQGFHLYYPNRRQTSPAFAAFVDALKYRG